MKQKVASIVLVFSMILTMLPTSAYATKSMENSDAEGAPVLEIIGNAVDANPTSKLDVIDDSSTELGDSENSSDDTADALPTLGEMAGSETKSEVSTEESETGPSDAENENAESGASQETPSSMEYNVCGENLTWSLEDGTLSISGTGRMSDYTWHVTDDEDLAEYVDAPWFDQRESIVRIVVEDGVTSIGANAFAACWMVNDVSIPDSVTDIGAGAFDGCGQNYDTMPIEDIGLIPQADTSIENVRYSVLALDISGSMGSKPMAAQKASAIKYCQSLLSADGINYVAVVSFGSSARIVSQFSNDIDALTTAINRMSGSGMTNTIGALTMADQLLSAAPSSAGRSIVLCSDGLPNTGGSSSSGPFTSSDSSSYYSYANAVYNKSIELMQKYDMFTLGFFHSLSGKELGFAQKFMPVIQNGGYYEVTDPEDLEFTFGDIAGDVVTPGHSGIIFTSVPKDKYIIHVVNDEGRNLQGVTVTCNGTSAQTNNNGLAQFNRSLFGGTPKITVSAPGYLEWTNANSNWTFDNRGYTTIKIYPLSAGTYKLSECVYSNDANMSMGTNLLVKTKTVSLGSNVWDLDFGNFYLSCKANKTDGIIQYELWQGSKKIKESTDGNFGKLSVDTDGFSENGRCFVRVITVTGEQVDTHINLQFKKAEVNKATSVTFGQESLSFGVSDDVPYLGGGNVKVSLPIELPVKVTVGTDGKVRVAMNSKGMSDWWGNVEKGNEQFENLKKMIDKIGTIKTFGGTWKDYKSLVDRKSKFGLPGVGDVDVYVAGYAEGDFNSSTLTGEIYLVVEAETKTFGFNTWVWVVPVTVQVKGTFELNAGGKLKFNWSAAQFEELLVKLDVDIGLDAFAGVGIGKAVGIGVYGKATVNLVASLGTTNGVNNVDLTGDLGIKAYLAWLEYSKPFAYNTWHLYTGNNVRTISGSYANEPMMAALYNTTNYRHHDLEYLVEESEWMGTPIMMLDASAATQLSSLISDTYRNAQPVMISTGSALYAAFLRADPTDGDVYTAVTKFDASGSWAEPVRVDSGAVLDGVPSLCAGPDGTIWLSYSKTAEDCGKTSLLDYAKKQTIVVGSIDPNTLAFTQKASFSGTGYVHLQQLSIVNGNPTLVWADSDVTDDDSVLWPASSDLYTAVCTSGSWGDAQQAASVSKPVIQLTAGTQDGNLSVAYVADEDGKPETGEDQNLYIGNSTTPVANSIQGKVTYAALPGQAADFIWNAENCLRTAGGKEIPAEGITHEYAVAGNRIYYSASNEKGANLRTVIYDGGSWSGAVDLTGGERYLENVSAVSWNGNDYVMGMDTLATIGNNNVTDAKNLVWGQIRPTSNLCLDGLDYNPDGLTAGASVPVKATVTNVGDHAVNSVDISINNGTASNHTCTIAPGESAEFTVNVTCPAVLTEYQFEVIETGQDDFTPEDNIASVDIGYADLVVHLEEERVGGQSSLVVYVSNEGVEPATGSITVTDVFGNQVQSTPFSDLETGSTFVASYPMKKGDVYTASASLAGNEKDLYTYNNTDSLRISAPDGTAAYTISFSAEGGTVAPSSAVTDSDGKLTGLPTPERSGYTFSGWYTSAEGGTLVSTETVFSTNTTVYAHWSANSSSEHTHSWNSAWNSDVSGHWHECSNPGCPVTENSKKDSYAAHVSDGGKVTTEATATTAGVRTYSCTVCGYIIKSESIPATGGGSSSSSGSGGGSASSYAVSVPSNTPNGTVRVNPTNASAGRKVTITATPNVGFDVGTITVTDKDGNQITITDAGDNKYVFTMPRTKVDVNVEFVKKQQMNPARFDDVAADTYYADAVQWAVENGITVGTSATTFSPNAPCTRAQVVTFLWRAAGSPKASSSNPFTDVASGKYYYDAVLWAVEKGITVGTSATTFSPDTVCTRAQIVTFLYRYKGSPAVSGSNTFGDVAADAYYATAVDWAVSAGVTVGTGNNTFSPSNDCTRAQTVTFLYRSMA
nr:S-layer homology domain-containing protein [uncultured Oscillibacter sp.]